MKQTINKHQFRHAFNECRPDNFSYEGQGELFDYLEQLEDDIGEEIELDVIAICCDYSQCSLDEFLDSYDVECDYNGSDEEKRIAISEYIESEGFWFAFVEDGKEIVFQNF